MKNFALFLTAAITLVLSAGENILTAMPWRVALANGGKMTAVKQDNTVILERTSANGSTIYLPRKDFSITPGATYEVAVKFQSLTPGAKIAVMLQTNDPKRRPFPVSGYTASGLAKIRLKANEIEKTLRIMLPMSSPGKIALESVTMTEIIPESNLLKDSSIRWGNRVRGGAKGKVTRNQDKTITMTRSNTAGQVIVVNDSPITLFNNADYTAGMTLQAGSVPVKARMVLQFPESKRKAVTEVVRLAPGELKSYAVKFTADAETKMVRIHLYLDSGMVDIKKIDFVEKKK